MNQNVRIAKELVRIAKQLMAATAYDLAQEAIDCTDPERLSRMAFGVFGL